jgi:hypothetical protein
MRALLAGQLSHTIKTLHDCDTFSNVKIEVEIFQDLHTFATRVLESNVLKLDASSVCWVQSSADFRIDNRGSVDEFKDTGPGANSTHN